jgi:hypothetical protein
MSIQGFIFRGFFNLDYNNTTLNMLNRNITVFPVIHRKLLYGLYTRLEKSSNFILFTIFNEMLHTNSLYLDHYLKVLLVNTP